VLFNPARYNSPPVRAKNSGEKPIVSVANIAWHISPSSSSGLRCGFLRSSECPPSADTGICVVEAGNSVLKTRGDHAPAVMTRRVHRTMRRRIS
jgi:hypothetical protein